MKILITGGAGFIGSALVRYILKETDHSVVNIDKLTYAGNLDSLKSVADSNRYQFEQLDICGRDKLEKIFQDFEPDAVMHLAAESHVDRSIDGPSEFIETNVVGTFTMLEVARKYWNSLGETKKTDFRFIHISTDEVYGDLAADDPMFTEDTPFDPSSPYSASKAASDHLVRAWGRTYGLPVMISNCSNNYGPCQFPEKLIPVIILRALKGELIPIYGDGTQVRDWLYVEDHVRALMTILEDGKVGETYNIGGHNEMKNIDVAKAICLILDQLRPEKPNGINNYSDLISFVDDRPGHDKRYAVDAGKIEKELGWTPDETFETGIKKTVKWFLDNADWCNRVLDGSYRGERLGTLGDLK